MKIKTASFEETIAFGEALGKLLGKGDIILLNGDLGTGKTVLTNGIARSLDIFEYITSPTFTLVNQYEGKLPLYHFDLYRIEDPEELFEIGFEEYIYGGGVVVIEWAERIKEILPCNHISVRIDKSLQDGVDVRIINVDFNGEGYNKYEEKLKEILRKV